MKILPTDYPCNALGKRIGGPIPKRAASSHMASDRPHVRTYHPKTKPREVNGEVQPMVGRYHMGMAAARDYW